MPDNEYHLTSRDSGYIPDMGGTSPKSKLERFKDSAMESIRISPEQKDRIKDTLAPAGRVAGFLLKNLAKAPLVPGFYLAKGGYALGQGLANSLGKDSSIGDIPRNIRNSYNADDSSVGKSLTATGKAIVTLGKSVAEAVKDYNDPERRVTVESHDFDDQFEIHREEQRPVVTTRTSESESEESVNTSTSDVSTHNDDIDDSNLYDPQAGHVSNADLDDEFSLLRQPVQETVRQEDPPKATSVLSQENSTVAEKRAELAEARTLQHEAYGKAKLAREAHFTIAESFLPRSEEFKGSLEEFKEATKVLEEANNKVSRLQDELQAAVEWDNELDDVLGMLQGSPRQETEGKTDIDELIERTDEWSKNATAEEKENLMKEFEAEVSVRSSNVDEDIARLLGELGSPDGQTEKVDMGAFLDDFDPNISPQQGTSDLDIRQDSSDSTISNQGLPELDDLLKEFVESPVPLRTKEQPQTVQQPEPRIVDDREPELDESMGGVPLQDIRENEGVVERSIPEKSVPPLSPEDQEKLDVLKKRLDTPRNWSLIAVSRVSDEVRTHILNFPSGSDAAKLLEELESNPQNMTSKGIGKENLEDKKLRDIVKIKKLYDANIDFETGMKK